MSEMMRYRPARRVPGKNRLSRNDVDDGFRPPDDWPPLLGDLGVAGRRAATVRVANVSSATLSPQDEQKRTFSAISVPQAAHLVIEFPATLNVG
jgi:hypothetical protein